MAKAEKRQVISAVGILPPFEVIDYPGSIPVKVKTPSGDIFTVSVAVQLLPDQFIYAEEAKEQIKAIEDGINLARADEVKMINKGEEHE